jgi:RNA-directed DNA polymerase
VNTGAPFPSLEEAQGRVLHFQRKLHEWASNDAERGFRDLWNLVCDPATLVVAWSWASRNRGSRSAGIDADTRRHVEARGVERFLRELRGELKASEFRPLPVRERLIPKRDGRKRRLGIPTLKDRVVQMALKLVLEPVFETGFYPSSYAYRPARRAQDAIAEIVHFTKAPSNYEWVIETDIEACFDRLPHRLIGDEVRRRIADRRVLALVRAFLKAGLMAETGRLERTVTGTPQGGIASPLLANIALSALDRHYQPDWQEMSRYTGRRQHLQRSGHPTYRLVRYADDLVVLVKGDPRAGAGAARPAGRVGRGARASVEVRQDRGHPHRRGLRVPRPADRPPPQGTEAPRLHLRLRRGAGLGPTQGEVPDRALHDQPGAVRADRWPDEETAADQSQGRAAGLKLPAPPVRVAG